MKGSMNPSYLFRTNKSYISKIENGLVDPSASLFFRILSALGLRFDIVKPYVQI